MTRVLVVDDEPAILRSVTIALGANNYEYAVAATAKQAIAKASTTPFDAIILDLGLPDLDGLEVIRMIRALPLDVPILILSAWQDIETRVTALDLGADDYVPKPFSMPELLARLRVALRHRSQEKGRTSNSSTIALGPLTIDIERRSVNIHGEVVELTRTQYETLLYFARHPNRVLTHRSIIAAVWPPDVDVDPQNLRVVVSQIRKKVELDPSNPSLITTDLGVGYRLAVDQP